MESQYLLTPKTTCRKSKRLGPEPKVGPDCGIWRELASLLSDTTLRHFLSCEDHLITNQTRVTPGKDPRQLRLASYSAFCTFDWNLGQKELYVAQSRVSGAATSRSPSAR